MNKTRTFAWLLYILVASSCQEGTYSGEVAPTAAKAKSTVVTDWIKLHLQLIRKNKGVQHVAYTRHFAYTGVALYESVVPSTPQYQSLAGQLNGLGSLPEAPKGKKVHPVASANAALAQMMRSFYGANPANMTSIDSLENVWQLSLQDNKAEWVTESAAYGKQVADAVIAWAATDRNDQAYGPYTPPVGPGLWKPTPPALAAASAPYWGNNRPVVASSQQGTTLPAPTPFSVNPESTFYAMVNQLYQTSKQLSTEQRAIALFWDDAPNGKYVTAFGHWISVLGQVAVEKQLSLIEVAGAYLKTAVAMNDACIATWKQKYTHNLIRPVTYIQENVDDKWLPVIVTPAHPEYPAAHATLSAAAATALTDALGGNIAFTDHTYDDMGFQPRSFTNFEAAGSEAGISRLYGGIHYQLSIDAGGVLGKKVAENVCSALRVKK